MLGSLCSCRRTVANPKRSAAWMIGTSLAAVLIALALQLTFGQTAYSEALLYAAFPIALVVADLPSGRWRDCSRTVRGVGLLVALVVAYALFLAVVILADAI